MFRRYLHNFGIQLPSFSPDDNVSMSVGNPEGDDADVLDDDDKSGDSDDDNSDESDESDDDKSKDKDNEDTEDDDNEEDEDEDKDKDNESEDDDDENEDDDKLEVPPSVKDIKAKYPKFFKEFPEVRAAIFREQRFTEMFSTPDDAKATVEKAELLDSIEDDLLNKADPTNLFAGISKSNKGTFEKFAINLLPTLQAQDKDLYTRVAAIPIKQLLRAALKEGKGDDGKLTDMGKSALWIHQFFFGKDAKMEDPVEGEVKRTVEKSDTEKKLEARLDEINRREYQSFKNSVDNSYVAKMSSEFKTALDKDERLTEFVKRTIIKDGLEEIRLQLEKDPRYTRQVGALWQQASKSGFSSDFKSRILNTALARAKSLVPSIRQRLVSEALGTKVRNKNKDKDKDKEPKREERRVVSGNNRPRNNERNSNKPMSDLDILRG